MVYVSSEAPDFDPEVLNARFPGISSDPSKPAIETFLESVNFGLQSPTITPTHEIY